MAAVAVGVGASASAGRTSAAAEGRSPRDGRPALEPVGPTSDAFVARTPESEVEKKMTLGRAPDRVGPDASADQVLAAAFPTGGGAHQPQEGDYGAQSMSPFDQFGPAARAKLDARLQLLVARADPQSQRGRGTETAGWAPDRVAGRAPDRPDGVASVPPPPTRGAPVRVLVETSDLDAARRAGLVVRTAAGGVATGMIAAGALDDVAALPSTHRISAPKMWQTMNDLGRKDVGVPDALSEFETDGKGVLVAVIDTGLDFEHPSFRNDDGGTRIAGLLDFSFPGDLDGDGTIDGPVAGGTLFTKADIDAALELGNGWEDRAVNGLVTPGELAEYSFEVEYQLPIRTFHTQLHIKGDLTTIQVALRDPDGWVYPLDLSAATATSLQATYIVPVDEGVRVDGEWQLAIRNQGEEDVSVLSWAFFADRRVFQEDLNGHGTHVTGTATGNGRLSAGPSLYAGVAPAADILFVRGDRAMDGFASDDIVAGMQWTDATAANMGRPYALNMSLGGAIGPHDGTEPEDKAVDALVGPGMLGKAIVIANGNSGGTAMHAGGSLAPGSNTIPLELVNPPDADGLSYTWVYLALEGRGDPVFGLEYPFPDELTCFTYVYDEAGDGTDPLEDCGAITRFGPGSPVMFQLFDEDGAAATVGTLAWERGERAHIVWIEWFDTEGYWVIPGEWGLVAHGLSGKWDGWQTGCMPLVDCDNLMTVGSPGSAVHAISVGSYNTRVVWTDQRRQRHQVDEALGALSGFSSRGPTRDGRIKPEITAPGQKVISVRSSDRALCPYVHPVFCEAPELGWSDDVSDDLLALQGTSMATPIVTGAVALLLQMDPRMDAREIKDILMETARTDGATGVDPNPDDWGAGKLDVASAARVVDERLVVGSRVFIPVAARGSVRERPRRAD